MKFTDIFFLIKKRLLETRNIILFFIIVVIFLILFTCFTIINFSKNNKNEIYNSETGRSLYVFNSKEVEEKINEVDNIKYFFSNKYISSERFEAKEFEDELSDGIILIKALINDDIKIMSGKNITTNNEMICSHYFYPHEYDNKLYSKQFLNGKNIVNKKIMVNSNNEDNIDEKVFLDIVGTYKNKYMEEANTCYVNIETYDKISQKYMFRLVDYDEKGNVVSTKNKEYEDYIVVVDDIKKLQSVKDKFVEIGIEYEELFKINLEFLNILYTVPIFVAIIVIFISICIIYSFITKKIYNRVNNIGLLKSFGYENRDITKIYIFENIFIVFLSFIVSLIIYLLALKYLSYNLLAEVTYNSYILEIPILYIILTMIFLLILITIFTNKNCNRLLKHNISELLLEGNA